jgi:class 3 adenylate cyclase
VAVVPRTQYAKSGELHLAYQVFGDGPIDLLVVSGYFPIDMLDEEPSMARFNRRLASFSRVVRFNPRGTGLSDRVARSDAPTLEQRMDDALTVLNVAGSERSAVFTFGWQAAEALALAAVHPKRVSHLIVVNGTARTLWAPDYPVGTSEAAIAADEELLFLPDAVERGLDQLARANPSVADNAAFRDWWDRAGNRAASPPVARAIMRMWRDADVRELLPSILVPTLVLHRRDNRALGIEHGRYLAEHLTNAKFVELKGGDHAYWVGETDVMLDEIEEFLTGVRQHVEADRTLAAVLFTDIVASTQRIVAIGERQWRDLLDRHDTALRHQLARFGGREIKTTGDGVLAIFDRPLHAVQCASAIRDAATQLGVSIRVGIHFGEVELREADISGLTVHIAARIHALAEPGEILVSRTMSDLVVGSSITCTNRGEHELKGVPGAWQLFSVTNA